MAALALVLEYFTIVPPHSVCLTKFDAPLDEANIGASRTRSSACHRTRNSSSSRTTNATWKLRARFTASRMEEVGVSKLVSVRFE